MRLAHFVLPLYFVSLHLFPSTTLIQLPVAQYTLRNTLISYRTQFLARMVAHLPEHHLHYRACSAAGIKGSY